VCKRLGKVTVASEACPDYLTVTCTLDEQGFTYSLQDKRTGPFTQADQNQGDFYERTAKELGCLEKHVVAASLRVSRQIYSKQILGERKGCGLCEQFKQPICPHPERRNTNDETCPSFVLQYVDENGKLVPARIADSILTGGELLLMTLRNTGEIYCYHADKGIWGSDGETRLQEHVQQIVSRKNPQGERLSIHVMAEVTAFVRRRTYVDQDIFAPPENLACVKNGVLDFATGILGPFSPNFGFRVAIPVTYDPTAECPAINRFLLEVVPDYVDTIYESCGYASVPGNELQKALIFVGYGQNGKSTLLKLIETFLGPENCTSRSLQELLENRFARADLDGKLANIHPDIPHRALKDTSTFKNLVGGDRLTAEHKFLKSFQFVNGAKLFYACNIVPETNDDSDAFYRRLIPIVFDKTIADDNVDPHLINKLTTETELSGLLNQAIAHRKTLLVRGKFSNAVSIETMRKVYSKMSDPISCFIEDMLIIGGDAATVKQELYAAFVTYCAVKKYGKAHSYKTFCIDFPKKMPTDSISEIRPKIGDSRGPRMWQGVQLLSLDGKPLQPTLDEVTKLLAKGREETP
jgi:putative DNA primase/helicase